MKAYSSLTNLLRRELVPADTLETRRLIAQLRGVRARGYLTRREFLQICEWKSPRSRGLCMRNSPAQIRSASRRAFQTKDERARFEALTGLQGVGAPTASAILTLCDPRRYGVIDIRVWQVLYEFGSVRTRPSGLGLNFKHWHNYLLALRHHAKALRVSVRRVEYSLFLHHERTRAGPLYAVRRLSSSR